jgi:hypothetical protein
MMVDTPKLKTSAIKLLLFYQSLVDLIVIGVELGRDNKNYFYSNTFIFLLFVVF